MSRENKQCQILAIGLKQVHQMKTVSMRPVIICANGFVLKSMRAGIDYLKLPKMLLESVIKLLLWIPPEECADICHAYQILRRGIPEDHIITMMVDDIAYNKRSVNTCSKCIRKLKELKQTSLLERFETNCSFWFSNPLPGVIWNSPNGPNVYKGVKIDYRGEDVTPQNFMNVLLGRKKEMAGIGTGRVLDSGHFDNVFINFVDHGDSGIISFPNGVLTAKELNETFIQMHKENRYNMLVAYIEACFSGSMFYDILSSNIRVFVTTAADRIQSSYACCWDNLIGAYLGDVYSVQWMNDSEHGCSDAVPSEDVPVEILKRKIASTKGKEQAEFENQLQQLLEKREMADSIISSISDPFEYLLKNPKTMKMKGTSPERSENKRRELDCHSKLVHAFNEICFNIGRNPYTAKIGRLFSQLCEGDVNEEKVILRMQERCSMKSKLADIY
ncbi:unnamed protein product [Soboliphyme baturini]|uniref:Legumain n=1 Tax=Soboliphyme baturini TaxID=241478 RepID=A0A183IN45_9BILA|nr:unnamed protein product [Soboliphyme baturini]